MPIAAFFESEPLEKELVFTQAGHRPTQTFGSTKMQNLAKDLIGNTVQPFIVTLQPGMGSGDHAIVHTGFEFIYCLSGSISYQVAQEEYILNTGDSLVFEAHKPHSWENTGEVPTQILLILYPTDEREKARRATFFARGNETGDKYENCSDYRRRKDHQSAFWSSPYYLVLTIEEGKVVSREMRDKMGHSQFHEETHAGESSGVGHGMDAQSHNKHISYGPDNCRLQSFALWRNGHGCL